MTTTSVRIRAQHARRIVSESGYDRYTGAVVRSVTGLPPVHASGAFRAYPYGMPDVPRT